MGTNPESFTLNAWQFEQALAILQREQQVNTPSARQEKNFKLLNIAIYGFAISLIMLLIIALIEYFLQSETLILPLAIIILIVFFISAVGITLLFFMNLSYVRKLLGQRKLARKLGLWEAMRIPWKTERRRNKLRNVSDLCILILGLYIVYSSVIPFLISDQEIWLSLAICPLMFAVGVAIIVTFFVRRSKERLRVITRLYSSLEGYRDEVEQNKENNIHIPAETYEKIAQIERSQIARDRVQIILNDKDNIGTSHYVLQKSHAAQQAQIRLDANTRLRVQDQIDALITEPHPPGIIEDPKSDAFQLRVPETPIIIGFTVDDQARRIQIHSVESSYNAESPTEPGE